MIEAIYFQFKGPFIICLFVNIVQVSHFNLLLACLFTEYTADLYAKDWLCDGNDGDDYKCRLVDELTYIFTHVQIHTYAQMHMCTHKHT